MNLLGPALGELIFLVLKSEWSELLLKNEVSFLCNLRARRVWMGSRKMQLFSLNLRKSASSVEK